MSLRCTTQAITIVSEISFLTTYWHITGYSVPLKLDEGKCHIMAWLSGSALVSNAGPSNWDSTQHAGTSNCIDQVCFPLSRNNLCWDQCMLRDLLPGQARGLDGIICDHYHL